MDIADRVVPADDPVAPVDDEVLAAHIGGLVRGQEGDQLGHIGVELVEALPGLGHITKEVLGHPRARPGEMELTLIP